MAYDTDVYFYDGTTYVRPDGFTLFKPPRYRPKEVVIPRGFGDGSFRYHLGRTDRVARGTCSFFLSTGGNDDFAYDNVKQLLDWEYNVSLKQPTKLTFNCDFFTMTNAILYVEDVDEVVGDFAYSYVVTFRIEECNNP